MAAFLLACVVGGCGSSSTSGHSSSNGTVSVTTGQVVVALAPTLSSQLSATGVKLAPVAPASSPSQGGISFRISGGQIDEASRSGTVQTSGGATFTGGNAPLTVSDPVVDVGSNVVSATVNGQTVTILHLASVASGVKTTGDTVAVNQASATIYPAFATTLDDTLGVTLFANAPQGATVSVNATVEPT